MNESALSSLPCRPAGFASTKPSALDWTIGGITPFTTIDFPGRLAAVLYTQGCLWRCYYCHNGHLQSFEKGAGKVAFSQALNFLEGRLGFLDGVVFCGGEPTAHAALPEAMKAVRRMGYEVALHTAGMFPEALREALPLCDWVGLDIKAPFVQYEKITQVKFSGEYARRSLSLLLKSRVDYEVRTTMHPDLLPETDVEKLARELQGMGVEHYAVQAFKPGGCTAGSLNQGLPCAPVISAELQKRLPRMFKSFVFRE